MLNLITLLILVGLAFFAWRAWQFSQRNQQQATAAPPPATGTVMDVQPGGMIQLPPHGDDLDAIDMQVTARHVYQQDGYEWYELEGEAARGTVWLDVERDDELETSVTLRRLNLEDTGLSDTQLSDLRPGNAPSLTIDGITLRLSERGSARFLPNGDASRAEDYEFWDFEGDDERHDLAIERWGQDVRVYLSERLTPSRIKIYSLGGSA